MNWLITFGPRPCDHIFSLITSFQNGISTLDDTIEGLDAALDIWNLAPQAWEDPDVLKWSRIFTEVEERKRSHYSASRSERKQLDSDLETLKLQALNAYCFSCYSAVLQAIDEYERGLISLNEPERRLRLAVNALEHCVPRGTLSKLIGGTAGLDLAIEAQAWSPTGMQRKVIEQEVSGAKELLLSLLAELDVE